MPDPVTLPWRALEGEGRLTLSVAKCETGWGDLSTRAPFEGRDFHPAPPLISCASTLPLQTSACTHLENRLEYRDLDDPRFWKCVHVGTAATIDKTRVFRRRRSLIKRCVHPLALQGRVNSNPPESNHSCVL